MLGPDQVLRMPPVAPSDDVSEFLRHLPGCYFLVGSSARPDGSSGMHHSPTFSVEDASLRVGRGVSWCAAQWRWQRRNGVHERAAHQ